MIWGRLLAVQRITVPEKRPYLLQANAEAHLDVYRAQVTSAVAMETEFQILNTLLAGKSAQLQLCEYQLFKIFCAWKGGCVGWFLVEVIHSLSYPIETTLN